ncbi:MAG: hypothetical protein AB2793_06260 [Candidatus Thiodiazotropha sp.]
MNKMQAQQELAQRKDQRLDDQQAALKRLAKEYTATPIPGSGPISQNPKPAYALNPMAEDMAVGAPEIMQRIMEAKMIPVPKDEGFTLPPGSTRYDAEGNVVASAPFAPEKVDASKAEKDAFDRAQKIRKEFLDVTDEFPKITNSYGRIQASIDNPSAAGDMALVFNYMKMLDPDSVVRESEYATAENARGVPDTIRNVYNKVLNGERLAPNQRQDFYNRSGKLYNKAFDAYEQREKEYKDLATRYSIDPERALISRVVYPRHEGDIGPPSIKSDEDYDNLPSGTEFIDPNGVLRRKP